MMSLMDKAFMTSLTGKNMKVNLKMGKNMDKELIIRIVVGVIIVVVFGYFGYMYKKGKYKKFANKILLNLIAEAEVMFGAKTGAIKNSYVFQMIYSYMPTLFRFFVSQDEVLDMIEDVLDQFKQYLKDNSEATDSLGISAEVK